MNIIIRLEEEKDYRHVEEVTRSAFAYPERIERGQIGCPYEHWMVNELRKRDGILSLSLVAVVDEKIVGHIICSKAEVRTINGITPVLNIGPISVLPEYQRKGVGKALITNMIDTTIAIFCFSIYRHTRISVPFLSFAFSTGPPNPLGPLARLIALDTGGAEVLLI